MTLRVGAGARIDIEPPKRALVRDVDGRLYVVDGGAVLLYDGSGNSLAFGPGPVVRVNGRVLVEDAEIVDAVRPR